MLTESVRDGLCFILDDGLLADGFIVAFTTTLNVNDQASRAGLDLSSRPENGPAGADEGRFLVASALGLPSQSLIFAEQVHGDRVSVVGKADIGAGSVPAKPPVADSDALVTAEERVPLTILTADCVPIALVDREVGVVAAVHAGWRGTLAKIVNRTVETMVRLGARPQRIEVRIGPAIGPCCYQVGPELFTRFTERFHIPVSGDNDLKLDLRDINQQILRDAGVSVANIETSGLCTACEDEMFYSWRVRRDAGRQGLIVARLA